MIVGLCVGVMATDADRCETSRGHRAGRDSGAALAHLHLALHRSTVDWFRMLYNDLRGNPHLDARGDGGVGQFAGMAMPSNSIAVSLTLGVCLLSRVSFAWLVEAGFAVASPAAVALWLTRGQSAVIVVALILAASFGIVQGASLA